MADVLREPVVLRPLYRSLSEADCRAILVECGCQVRERLTIDEHTPFALMVVFYHGDKYGPATLYRLRQLTQVVQLAWFCREVK